MILINVNINSWKMRKCILFVSLECFSGNIVYVGVGSGERKCEKIEVVKYNRLYIFEDYFVKKLFCKWEF